MTGPHEMGTTLEATEREKWLKPSQVADLFEESGLWRVPRGTWWDWANSRGITFKRTPGRHRLYAESEVRLFIAEISKPAGAVA